MKTSSVVAVVAGCMVLLACDMQPQVLFVTAGNPFRALQLTDAQEGCRAPARVCYFTTLDDGRSSEGCWVLEQAFIHANFPDLGDKLVPVSEFRRTTLAEYRNATLE